MSTGKTFRQQIDELQATAENLEDGFDDIHVEEVATRLEGLNFSPPIITPTKSFLRLRRTSLLAEINRILTMPDAEACVLAPDNSAKCEDLRVQFITTLLFYYKKLLELRRGNPEEWDEIDELYVHD